MKVVFNTWSGAFFNPGGGETQLVETRRHLERKGVQVDLYDQWNPLRDVDVFHQFSIQHGVDYPMTGYCHLGSKIALSTILWVEYPADHPEVHRVRHIMSIADILFTNSVAESDLLSRVFAIERTRFHETRNGVAEVYLNRKTDKDFRAQFDLPEKFILSVANIDRRKNTLKLVQACRAIGKALVLVGHVRDPGYFREIEAQHAGHFVHVGPVGDSSVLKSAYQQCELFALPSLCETPGIAALEAGSQGCKIMITSEGCAREYFGDRVTYVNPFDDQGIVQGLKEELSLQRYTDEISSHITSNFTWVQAAEDVRRGYEKILV